VRDSAVGEGSGVDVCSAAGIFVSIGDTGTTTRGVSVGSGIPVGSITGTGVGAQAVRKMKAAMMEIFIEGNYM
jgi:hypothetical protein